MTFSLRSHIAKILTSRLIPSHFRAALLCGFVAALAGCITSGKPSHTTAYREVGVTWLGENSYRITSSLGTTIITNPYVDGFPAAQRPDIVLITTGRADSNNIDAFDNSPTVFRGSAAIGLYSSKGTRIRGVPIYENPLAESPEGMSLVFLWRMEGMHICFIENLKRQTELSPAQVNQIGPVDVLFVPASNVAKKLAEQLNARIVIPIGPDGAATAGTFPAKLSLPGASVFFSLDSMPEKQTGIALAHPLR